MDPSSAVEADLRPAFGPMRQDQLRILQEHLGSLQHETQGWLDRQARVWQTAIAGVAAVFVLRQDTEIETFLPLAPILAMAVLAQWLSLVVMVVRAGRSMAVDEYRLNDLLGGPPLLTHEIGLWDRRARRFELLYRLKLYVAAGVLVVGGAYSLLLWRVLRAPALDLSTETSLAYAVAGGIALALAVANLARTLGLRRLEEPAREARQGRASLPQARRRGSPEPAASPGRPGGVEGGWRRPSARMTAVLSLLVGLLVLVWRLLREPRGRRSRVSQ